jgi:hypothetical protein
MNLSGTLDQDPKVQERWRGAHREGCQRRVSGGATVNGVGASMAFGDWEKGLRGASRSGEVEGVVGGLDLFLERRWEADGGLLDAAASVTNVGVDTLWIGTRGGRQGGAPGRGEKIEAGEGMRGSLVSPDFGVLARSNGKLRWVNLSAWRRFKQGKRDSRERGIRGYLWSDSRRLKGAQG